MKTNRILSTLVVAGALSFAGSATAASEPAVDDIESLKKKISELDQKVKVLERKREIDQDAAAETAKTAPSFSIGSNGFTARTSDTNFLLRIRGYVQTDARFYPDSYNTGIHNTFLLRRVRPILEGTVYNKFDYRVMLDFGQNSVSGSTTANQGPILDAYVNARLRPEFQIQVGKFKTPLGLERGQSSANMLFPEFGLETQLTPNYDVGVLVQGDVLNNTVNYTVGAVNGVQDGGSGDFDSTDGGKDFVGRVFAQPFRNTGVTGLKGLGLGAGGSYGEQTGSLRSFTSPGQQKIFSYYSGDGSTAAKPGITAKGNHWRFAPQAYWYVGPFGILGEYVVSSQDVRRTAGKSITSRELANTGWQVAGSYFLTGEENSFKPVAPLSPWARGSDGWGAVELVARVSQLNIDHDAFKQYADPSLSVRRATEWGAGVNWHLNTNLKLSAAFENTFYDGGQKNTATADSEKAVFVRAQVSF